MSKRNTFWSSCPRGLKAFPTQECFLAKSEGRSCEWFIKSKEDHYCFWKWLRRVSSTDGMVDPISLSQIAELLDLPQGKISQFAEEAEKNLKKIMELSELDE